ncbi:MAG: DUF2334 domain-containing protein [Armatimonadota bacterium]
MRKRTSLLLVVLLLGAAAAASAGGGPRGAAAGPVDAAAPASDRSPVAAGPALPEVLILYDNAGQYGWIGRIHARMLANLLGHFPVAWQAAPVEGYRKGTMARYAATFYIGSTYDNRLPGAFMADVMATDTPICWFKYNIWQLAWTRGDFSTRFGFTFNWLDWSGYDTISYRGQSYTKHQADPELGLVWVLHPETCQEVATAWRTTAKGEESIPYVVHGRNLWYVADLPFSYVTEEDRYLVFCDLLYDILGMAPPNTKRAICRIEDVDPTADPTQLRAIADYLYSRGVPFAVSVIPVYRDPLGWYSGGVAEEARLSDERQVVNALKYMVSKGGTIVLHGYTHQYGNVPNPYTGVTGDDFEFYRIELDGEGNTVLTAPVSEDSKGWARGRVSSGLAELRKSGLTAAAWETPHYAASATDYQAFASMLPLTIQRVLYFDLRLPASGFKGDGEPSFLGGQFFPYVIERDVYGQKVLPENLGNYEPDPWEGYRRWLVADILRCAEKNLALRDAWASFYFHPFYDISALQQIVEGIQGMGYTFVPVSGGLE